MQAGQILRKYLLPAAGVAAVAFVLLMIGAWGVAMRSEGEAVALRAELAEAAPPAALTDDERAEMVRVARSTRERPPAPEPPASAADAGPRPRDLMHPFYDAMFGREPAERPIHDWLIDVRLARTQPAPAPTPEALASLEAIAPALDSLAAHLARWRDTPPGLLVVPGDDKGRHELQHARALVLAAACAESLAPSGDRARGERLLEAAWILHRGLPPGIDDAGPGDLLMAVLRQARVGDAGAWDARLAELDPQRRLMEALEWDAEARLARHQGNAERRRKADATTLEGFVERIVGEIETKHDSVFTTRIAASEMTLAGQVSELAPCDDPWQLSGLNTGAMRRHWPVPAEVRMRVALASASRAQADLALTRHVLRRRHGLEPPQAACEDLALVEKHAGGDRFVVGWIVEGSGEPGPAPRERPGNHAPGFRTWPEPSLPGAPMEPFEFEAASEPRPVMASAPTE